MKVDQILLQCSARVLEQVLCVVKEIQTFLNDYEDKDMTATQEYYLMLYVESLFVHVWDRHIYKNHPEKIRNLLIDFIVQDLIRCNARFLDLPESKLTAHEQANLKFFNEATIRYAQWPRIIAQKEESPLGSIAYHFADEVGDMLEIEKTLAYFAMWQSQILESLQAINFEEQLHLLRDLQAR